MPEDTRLTEQDAAHLLRRAGFGPRGKEAREWSGKKRRTAANHVIPKKGKKTRGPAGKKNRQKRSRACAYPSACAS